MVSVLHIHTGLEHVRLAGLLPLGACGSWSSAPCKGTLRQRWRVLWGLDGFPPAKKKKKSNQYNMTGLSVTSLSQCMNVSGFTGYICFKNLFLCSSSHS